MDPWAAVIIVTFIGCLIVILTEKVDKVAVITLGAIIVSVTLTIALPEFQEETVQKIFGLIDFSTIVIMYGVLLTSIVINYSGLFQWIAIRIVKLTKGDPEKLMIVLVMMTIILSSLLTILAAAVIISRLTTSITKALDIDPKPYLFVEALSVSIGGTTSLIAAPGSIIIASWYNLGFTFFAVYTMPFGILVGFLFAYLMAKKMTSGTTVTELRRLVLMDFDEWSLVPDKFLFYVSAIVLAGMIIGFVFFPASLVAIIGPTILLLISGKSFEEVSKDVEWKDILFFVGLFIVVGAVDKTGVLEEIGELLAYVSGGNPLVPLLLIIWITGISSGFLDSVSIVLTFLPIIDGLVYTANFQHYLPVFIVALILSTSLGGALTPVGTPANLIALSALEREGGRVSFKEFLLMGFKIVVINLIFATLYLSILFFVFSL
ncbi:MAG: SLC13 family permease [Candidatus Asgardarchaeia archaeon]